MKVKVISRNPDHYLRETKLDLHKLPRNYDPSQHPFEVGREYTRALNATKLEAILAKPFVGSLDGHRDSINLLAKHPRSLSALYSGSADGEIRRWSVPGRRCLATVAAHTGHVSGLAVSNVNPDLLVSTGNDKSIRLWKLTEDFDTMDSSIETLNTILGKSPFMGLDHHYEQSLFATGGHCVDIWDSNRSNSVRSFQWGADSVHAVKFNPSEVHLLASLGSDRSVALYDARGKVPLRKLILKMKSNALSWNPMEPFVFVVANEDYNLYSFDCRRLDSPVQLHKDHVSAVIDVDFAPTGREFVSGGYDKTVRIFGWDQRFSREVYHTKRMQLVSAVRWSGDNKFIYSASDEMNIRIWKAERSEKLGATSYREQRALRYSAALRERFRHHPEIRRIARHRHVPKSVYWAGRELRDIGAAQRRKEDRRRKHSRPGSRPSKPEREGTVEGVVE